MIDDPIIDLVKRQLDLYLKGEEGAVNVDEVIGIEEGPDVGDEIKIFEATFNDKTYIYDEEDQKTIVGKVSEKNKVIHLARCEEGWHIFFAQYDDAADLFGDYLFLGLVPDTQTKGIRQSFEVVNLRVRLTLVSLISEFKSRL